MQPTLFEPVVTSVQQVNRERDAAIRRVAERAEQARHGFQVEAQAFVLAYLSQHGATSGEALTWACKAAGIVAHDDRAMGSVFQTLCRRQQIVKVGTCARMRGHKTNGGNIWNLAGK